MTIKSTLLDRRTQRLGSQTQRKRTGSKRWRQLLTFFPEAEEEWLGLRRPAMSQTQSCTSPQCSSSARHGSHKAAFLSNKRSHTQSCTSPQCSSSARHCSHKAALLSNKRSHTQSCTSLQCSSSARHCSHKAALFSNKRSHTQSCTSPQCSSSARHCSHKAALLSNKRSHTQLWIVGDFFSTWKYYKGFRKKYRKKRS